jgi:OTU domain-containing protein 6
MQPLKILSLILLCFSLYFAIAHQLSQKSEIGLASVPALRKITAEYLREHETDLRPFTLCPNTGQELSKEQYSQYCDRTENNSSEWGGQLEVSTNLYPHYFHS